MEEKRKITKEEGEKFKNDYDLDLFMEVSDRTGENITEIFVEAAKLLYNKYEKNKRDKVKDYEKLNKQKKIKEKKTQDGSKCLFI